MLFRNRAWWLLLSALLGLRLLTMGWFPLTDTTEARYAEVARLMAATGDWITPWFAEGVPFWGKPPLAFWSEALSFKLFGINEFAVRLPSRLATVGTLALIHVYSRSHFGRSVAMWAVLVYATSALVYIVAGAVLMDPFLAFATTWAMVAFAMSTRQPSWMWRYGFFASLAVGLLAKGPLVMVLVAGALIPWMIWHPSARKSFMQLPWFAGLSLMAFLSFPWYVAAELRTPGFLNYFLIGEHFLRFIDSGWTGDLYGTAHQEAKGTIWIHALIAAFPWGAVALFMLLQGLLGSARKQKLRLALQDKDKSYLVTWMLFPLLLFTFAGNILWTYVLPALAAFSVLIGISLASWQEKSPKVRLGFYALVGFVPLVVTGYMALHIIQPDKLKTEKELVAYAFRHMTGGDELVFVGPIPFSAMFYARGLTRSVADFNWASKSGSSSIRYLAIPREDFDQMAKNISRPFTKVFESRHFILIFVEHPRNPDSQQS